MNVRSFFVLLAAWSLMTTNVSAQQPGEIVFSKGLISPASPANLTTQFQAGEPIYAVAYFDKKIIEMARSSSPSSMVMEIFIYELKPPLYDYQDPSEIQLDFGSLTVSGSALQNAHLQVDVVPTPDQMTAYGSEELVYREYGPQRDGPSKFAAALAKLEPGEHTIIVKVNINYEFRAEGRFTLSGDAFSTYGEKGAALSNAAANIATASARMPESKRNDNALVADMNRAFKASQTYKDRIGGDIVRTVIIDPDWMIRRNELTGIILHRYIRAAIAVKNSDGSCTVWQLVTFQQDYVGNAFQATKFDGVGDPYKIPCENVNG